MEEGVGSYHFRNFHTYLLNILEGGNNTVTNGVRLSDSIFKFFLTDETLLPPSPSHERKASQLAENPRQWYTWNHKVR